MSHRVVLWAQFHFSTSRSTWFPFDFRPFSALLQHVISQNPSGTPLRARGGMLMCRADEAPWRRAGPERATPPPESAWPRPSLQGAGEAGSARAAPPCWKVCTFLLRERARCCGFNRNNTYGAGIKRICESNCGICVVFDEPQREVKPWGVKVRGAEDILCNSVKISIKK